MRRSTFNLNKLSIDWTSVLGTDRLGLDAVELDQLQSSLVTHAPRSLRVHPACTASQLPFQVLPVPWHRRGFWLSESNIRPGAFLQYAAGDYYIQDASSMLAMTLCRIQPGQIVCDLCAAPGGKATGLLEDLAGSGFLLANEVIQSRLALLQSVLYRTRLGNHAVSNLDVSHLARQLPQQFDCVLVDAPCSGQTMIARDKQSAAAFSPAQVEHCAARQSRILSTAAELVRPGGRLVYSTCTFAVAENELIVENFLQHNPDWQLDPLPALDPWKSPRLPGTYRLWPHRDNCDGSFAAALIRNSAGSVRELSDQLCWSKSNRWRRWSGSVSQLDFFSSNDCLRTNHALWQAGDAVHLFRNSPWPHVAAVCHSGIEIAKLYPKRIEPTYAAAIVHFDEFQPRTSLNLSAQQAVQFVQGHTFSIEQPAETDIRPADWVRVCWQGRPLAWGKQIDGTLKNHFPKLLRNPGITAPADW